MKSLYTSVVDSSEWYRPVCSCNGRFSFCAIRTGSYRFAELRLQILSLVDNALGISHGTSDEVINRFVITDNHVTAMLAD